MISFRFLPSLVLVAGLGAFAAGCSRSAPAEPDAAEAPAWMTDAKAAFARAQTEDKLVLMDFTGSDWCPPCQMLEREVFTKAAFKDYADGKLVLLRIDFPNKKPQSEAEKAQNFALQDKYNIPGYPTILVLDAQGKELGRLGYEAGGAQAWVAKLRTIAKS